MHAHDEPICRRLNGVFCSDNRSKRLARYANVGILDDWSDVAVIAGPMLDVFSYSCFIAMPTANVDVALKHIFGLVMFWHRSDGL